ncbi:MAG: glycoside hydrolase family 127 protein, partial [Saprospiraceae bacterium]|nr:glycoside hydrolase family 127 protein [Saprospiraceae bacterium]
MKKHFSQLLWVLMGCWALGSCAAPQAEVGELDLGYPLEPVDIRKVSLTDNFWLPVIEMVQEKTIAYALAKCSEEGRMDNFLIAGGQMPGETRGAMPFDDTDLYKIIEGASSSLITAPNPELERRLDTLIGII